MISAEDLLSIPIFAQLENTDREHFATRAADVRLLAHEWLIHEGEPSSFYALLEGSVEMWKDLNGKQELLLTRGPNEFFGEMPLLLGSPSLVSIRAIERCRLARFDRQQLQELIRDYPGFGSAIFATLNERFLKTQDWARATPIARVILRGQHAHPLWPALRSFLFANHVPYTFLPEVPGTSISNDLSQIAIEVDGSALIAPFTLTKIAKALNMQVEPGAKLYDLVVVGAGPAGMASAVYAASEGLKTLVIERAAAGGQAGTSSRIENYLGFPGGVSGDELSGRALKQAQRFGAEIMVTRSVTSLCKEENLFHTVIEGGDEVHSRCLLLATGVDWRILEAPGIPALLGRGVFYGASRTEAISLAGRIVYVVGGGNSAGQAAMFLSSYAAEVRVLVRGSRLASSMSHYLIDQLETRSNVIIETQTSVHAVVGEGLLEQIQLTRPGESVLTRPADALFIMIGADARTEWLPAEIERDERGYVKTGLQLRTWQLERPAFPLESSVPGLFCAGDVRSGSIKRVASSVGEGSMSVSFIHEYLAFPQP